MALVSTRATSRVIGILAVNDSRRPWVLSFGLFSPTTEATSTGRWTTQELTYRSTSACARQAELMPGTHMARSAVRVNGSSYELQTGDTDPRWTFGQAMEGLRSATTRRSLPQRLT